jgi:hypothetical protein
MAVIKKRTLILSNGKQIKLQGITLCIANSLEVGEGFTRNLLFFDPNQVKDAAAAVEVANPYHLTQDELMEVADYMISLWMQLKEKVRQHGMKSSDIFKRNP